jgi:hypothetical protein
MFLSNKHTFEAEGLFHRHKQRTRGEEKEAIPFLTMPLN